MRVICVLLVFTLSGCFSYSPIDLRAPKQRDTVRVTLSRPEDFRLAQYTANDVVRIEGEVIALDESFLHLSAWALRAQSGYQMPAHGETVRIPRGALAGVEHKQISPARSALVAGLAVLVGVVISVAAGGSGGEEGGGGGPPSGQ
jgi:hypothetical protein